MSRQSYKTGTGEGAHTMSLPICELGQKAGSRSLWIDINYLLSWPRKISEMERRKKGNNNKCRICRKEKGEEGGGRRKEMTGEGGLPFPHART